MGGFARRMRLRAIAKTFGGKAAEGDLLRTRCSSSHQAFVAIKATAESAVSAGQRVEDLCAFLWDKGPTVEVMLQTRAYARSLALETRQPALSEALDSTDAPGALRVFMRGDSFVVPNFLERTTWDDFQ